MTNTTRIADSDAAALFQEEDERKITIATHAGLLLVACALGLIANWISTGASPAVALPGMAILYVVCVVGLLMARVIPLRLPSVAWISLVAILITIPGFPGAATVSAAVDKLNFTSLATPALAYAGLALTQTEFAIARRSGWKIVIVAVCVMLGTYLGSVVIADLTLRLGN